MLNDATSNEFSYVEDWLLYYAQRRNIIQRFAQCAAGAIISALFVCNRPRCNPGEPSRNNECFGSNRGALFVGYCLPVVPIMWTLGGWICPRCRELSFIRHSCGTRSAVDVVIAAFGDLQAPRSLMCCTAEPCLKRLVIGNYVSYALYAFSSCLNSLTSSIAYVSPSPVTVPTAFTLLVSRLSLCSFDSFARLIFQ